MTAAGCQPIDSFGAGDLNQASAIGLDTTSTTIYAVDDATDRVVMFGPPAAGPPVVEGEWASSVGVSTATLHATVAAAGSATTCHLQYVPDGAFQSAGYAPASSAACTPPSLGSGFADQPAAVSVAGLSQGTTYHYRFVATSSAGTTAGPDHTLTTETPISGLQDGRGYELVTPAAKDSTAPGHRYGNVVGDVAAAGGAAMAYESLEPMPGSQQGGVNAFLASRGADGWSSQALMPAQSSNGFALCSPLVSDYSSDLSKNVLADGAFQSLGCSTDSPPLVPGEPQGVGNLFVHDIASGAYHLISLNPVSGSPADAHFDAATEDLGHVVFHESAQLTADAPSGVENLYDWSSGSVHLVSVLPNGTPDAGGARLAGTNSNPSLADPRHAISVDGSKLFFQGSDGNLYVRIDDSRTVQVDAAAPGASGPGGGGRFQIASTDGSKVFFTDDASAGLTADTVSGSGQNLYEYDLNLGTLTDLTPAGDVQVQGLSGAADDGSYVYFVATGALARGATSGGENLYVWHAGAIIFVVTLDSFTPANGGVTDACDWNPNCDSVRVTPDGTHIAFDSDLSLTPVDTGGTTEIYLYDAGTASLTCASCNRNGLPTTAPASIGVSTDPPGYMPHNLSADGSRVFFNTTQQLVARAANGRQNVYEYEEQGAGSCTTQGGCIYLLSSGSATTDDWFSDATPNGSDVFFLSGQPLVPQDTDDAFDIYDARVGGGFPFTPPPPSCSGDACRSLTAAPPAPVAASVSFSGPGNLAGSAPSSPASVRVLRGAVHGSSFVVIVAVPASGRVTVAGLDVRRVSRSVGQAGRIRLLIGLTPRARLALKHHKLRVRLTVSYMSADGASASVALTFMVKG